MTRITARILLGLPGLFIFATGLVFLTNPVVAAEKLRLAADTAEGLSNIRGMAGAPLFAVGSSLLLAAITEKLEYARPAAIFLLALITARLASHAFDGPTGAIALFIAVPSVTFAAMLAGHGLLVRGSHGPAGGGDRAAVGLANTGGQHDADEEAQPCSTFG